MAEPASITCPECLKKFKTKGDVTGKKVRCPFCKETFAVAADGNPVSAKAEAPAAAKSGDDIDPYKATDQDLRARCPNCANEMANKDATICLYCGYNTLTREWGKTVKTVAHTKTQILLHLLPGIAVFGMLMTLLMLMLAYCLILPNKVAGSWMAFMDAESLRMWLSIIGMGVVWTTGMFCYKRFLIEPLPPEIEKE